MLVDRNIKIPQLSVRFCCWLWFLEAAATDISAEKYQTLVLEAKENVFSNQEVITFR